MFSHKDIMLMSGLMAARSFYDNASIEQRKNRNFALQMVCLHGSMIEFIENDYSPDADFFEDWLNLIWSHLIRGRVGKTTISMMRQHCQAQIFEQLMLMDELSLLSSVLHEQHPIALCLSDENYRSLRLRLLQKQRVNMHYITDVTSPLSGEEQIQEGSSVKKNITLDASKMSSPSTGNQNLVGIGRAVSPTKSDDDLESINLSEQQPNTVMQATEIQHSSIDESGFDGCCGFWCFFRANKEKDQPQINETLVVSPVSSLSE